MVFYYSSAQLETNIFPTAGGKPDAPPSPTPTGGYDVSPEQLASITRERDLIAFQKSGGVKRLAERLKTNPDKGIHEDESNILERKNVFGSNTYPRRKGNSFWRFLYDGCGDTTLIILMVAAAALLALGIITEGIKGGYDGGSIALGVIIVMVVKAMHEYKSSLKFQNLNEEKQNIQCQVVRGGRRMMISIFDIVVGDVIHLTIGDQVICFSFLVISVFALVYTSFVNQVPADGVFISGNSLSIDESSMTGESQTVDKDHKSPFLMAGCKVADGCGTMMVSSNPK
uniref:Cation-transporting P-type ATPase N-terminal domain-containing protein n=1 Tax=Lactuca sativa TaxID=4236 RepID=A0A9R1UQ10_LACSA|nr:hypothetical protein LSAT_V11C800416830 [Lactuca sativa]